MTTKTYVTVSNHSIEYQPTPKVAAFLRRLEEAVSDPKVSERDMTGLAYSLENPILDHTMFPGRGAVTPAVLEDPAYHVMTDLLFRKHVVENDVDVAKIAAKYTMSPTAAAAELGITDSAVRQMIAARRIPAWRKDGKYFIDPRTLKTLDLRPRGPKAGSGTAGPRRGAGRARGL